MSDMAEYVCELTDDYPDVSFDSDDYSGTVERRERIVRCRDCEHGYQFCDSSSYAGWLDCLYFAEWDYYADVPGHCPVRPDFFCAHGETEEDE